MKEVLGGGMNYVNSIKTGLSSDPLMVRSISEFNCKLTFHLKTKGKFYTKLSFL